MILEKKLLVVVSMMTGYGPTGVETHFNQIMINAEKIGVKTVLVTPYTKKIIRKVSSGIGKLFWHFSVEYMMMWHRVFSLVILKYELKK